MMCYSLHYYSPYLLFFKTLQFLTSLNKGPIKRSQHVGSNTIQHVKTVWLTYWNMLDHVGECRMKFDFNQTFVPTSSNISDVF